MNLGDGQHQIIQRVQVAADDRLQGRNHANDGHHRINRLMRCRPMPAAPGDMDIGRIDGGHIGPRRGQEFAEGQIGRVMDTVNLPHIEAVHHPFLDHDLAPAAVFFGWLEQQRHAPGKAARFAQVFRGAQQHGDMAVMAAGMHLAGQGGTVVCAGDLINRQGIHIGAQANGGTRPLPVDDGHDAGRGDAFVEFIHPEFPQAVGDEGSGDVTIESQLGVLVQMASPGRHVCGIIGDTVQNGHCGLRASVSAKP